MNANCGTAARCITYASDDTARNRTPPSVTTCVLPLATANVATAMIGTSSVTRSNVQPP
jgi:hypothetical protein